MLAEQGHGYAMRRLPGFRGWKGLKIMTVIMRLAMCNRSSWTSTGQKRKHREQASKPDKKSIRAQIDAVGLHGSQNSFRVLYLEGSELGFENMLPSLSHHDRCIRFGCRGPPRELEQFPGFNTSKALLS